MNKFKDARETSGLSFRDISIKLKEQTGKDVGRKYIHKLISSPGMCKNKAMIVKVGGIIGLEETEAVAEWQRMRKEHLDALVSIRMLRGGK